MGSARHRGSIWVSGGQAGGKQRGLLWRRVQVVLTSKACSFMLKEMELVPASHCFSLIEFCSTRCLLLCTSNLRPFKATESVFDDNMFDSRLLSGHRAAARLSLASPSVGEGGAATETSRVTFAAPASHSSPPDFHPLQMLPVASGESVLPRLCCLRWSRGQRSQSAQLSHLYGSCRGLR